MSSSTSDVAASSGRRLALAGAVWGFAEATLFFIVPDVLITFAALRREPRTTTQVVVGALAGAVTGGAFMYALGTHDPAGTAAVVEAVPAVSVGMLEDVRSALLSDGASAMIFGPLTGTPYKTFAALSPGADVAPVTFLLVSVPARVVRFALSGALVHGAMRVGGSPSTWRGVLITFWILFYAWYLTTMPW